MPAPRTGNQWPTAGDRSTPCRLQYALEALDEIGGLSDPMWTTFGAIWWAKVISEALIKDETSAPMRWHAEGPYRADLEGYFNGTTQPPGITATGGLGIRILTPLRVLKVIQIEHPLEKRRTLIAHCAKAIN